MGDMFEQLKREVEEERRRLYAERFDTPPLEQRSLIDKKIAR